MKALLPLLLLFLMLVPTTMVASGVGEFRQPGVVTGVNAFYDHWLFGAHSVINITVTNVVNTTIFFDMTERFDGGGGYLNMSGWTNVNGEIQIIQDTYDTSRIGWLFWFLGSNLPSGSNVYKGFPMTASQAIFGKILLGDRRDTEYYKFRVLGTAGYYEWDRASGILTEKTFDFGNGVKDSTVLTSTNVWGANGWWSFVAGSMSFFGFLMSIVLNPITAGLLLFYFLSFLPIRIYDWGKRRSKKMGGVSGSAFWHQIKILVVAMLIFYAILFLALYLIGLAIRGG